MAHNFFKENNVRYVVLLVSDGIAPRCLSTGIWLFYIFYIIIYRFNLLLTYDTTIYTQLTTPYYSLSTQCERGICPGITCAAIFDRTFKVTLCDGKLSYDAIIIRAYYECLSREVDGSFTRYVEPICPQYYPLVKRLDKTDGVQCWNPAIHGMN